MAERRKLSATGAMAAGTIGAGAVGAGAHTAASIQASRGIRAIKNRKRGDFIDALRAGEKANRMIKSNVKLRRVGNIGVAAALGGAVATPIAVAGKEKLIKKSAWGVEHTGEVEKADRAKRHIAAGTGFGATLGPAGAAIHSGVTGKKGKRLSAGAVSGATTFGGMLLGTAAGGRSSAGRIIGSVGGAGLGGYLGAVNNVQHGRVAGLRARKYPMSSSRKKS